MEFNSAQTLGNLSKGDRFTFPGDTKVWQVTGRFKNQISYNDINQVSGRQTLRFDKVAREDRAVRFLRHSNTQEVK
jgi:hypothetical protein